jgi:site-specific recombinase XerC
MTPIAPHIAAFLRERLPIERQTSEHTCDSYAYAFQLLFEFASQKLKAKPSGVAARTD